MRVCAAAGSVVGDTAVLQAACAMVREAAVAAFERASGARGGGGESAAGELAALCENLNEPPRGAGPAGAPLTATRNAARHMASNAARTR